MPDPATLDDDDDVVSLQSISLHVMDPKLTFL